jgi:hypothetical protein
VADAHQDALPTPRLRVRGWGDLYENNRTREYKTLKWWPCPNDLGTDHYTAILDHPDGAAHFGAWAATLCVASTTRPRGLLVRENGVPHDAQSLARITRMPFSVFAAALPRFLEIGLLEDIDNKPHKVKLIVSQGAAVKPQSKYVERTNERNEKNEQNEQNEQKETNERTNENEAPVRPDGPPSIEAIEQVRDWLFEFMDKKWPRPDEIVAAEVLTAMNGAPLDDLQLLLNQLLNQGQKPTGSFMWFVPVVRKYFAEGEYGKTA